LWFISGILYRFCKDSKGNSNVRVYHDPPTVPSPSQMVLKIREDKRQTRGKQESDKRQTRGRQEGDKRQTRGRQDGDKGRQEADKSETKGGDTINTRSTRFAQRICFNFLMGL